MIVTANIELDEGNAVIVDYFDIKVGDRVIYALTRDCIKYGVVIRTTPHYVYTSNSYYRVPKSACIKLN